MVTRSFSEFASEVTFDALPEAAVHEVKRALLDYVGVTLLGAPHPVTRTLFGVLRRDGRVGGAGAVPVIGLAERLGPVDAAWVNGTTGHIYDFDDVHSAAGIHPGVVILPAAISTAYEAGLSGAEFIRAAAVGFEVAGRLGEATQLGHYEPGWHSTGTVGTVGAAAAAAAGLGLEPSSIAAAIGAATCEASGLREGFGTMMKALHAGNAAANGVRAALLCAEGFTAPLLGLEGERGFLAVACEGPVDEEAMVAGLGSEYRFLRKGYKLYSCGGVIHPALDAALALRSRVGDPSGISAVDVVVHPQVPEQMRRSDPRTGTEAKFTPSYCVAVALIDGQVLPAQFADERVVREDVVGLMGRTVVRTDAGLRKDEAVVTVTDGRGETWTFHTEHAAGYSPDNPASDGQLEGKFRVIVDGLGLGSARCDSFIDAVWGLERVGEFGVVLEGLGQPES